MAGRLQNEDSKSLSELTGAGGTIDQLLNDTKIYVTANSINKQLSQAIIDGEIGGGTGINYITNPEASSSTAGWATYADAAAPAPVNGTGGSPVITLTRTTTTPLRGIASFLITKDAANRQGEGVSTDFTMDRANQSQMLRVAFDYQIASGTYEDGDMRVYLYDVTNSQLINLSVQNLAANMPFFTYQGFAQAPANSTSLRLIIHIASTSALAYNIKFDNVNVGPAQAIVNVNPLTVVRGTQDTGQTIANGTTDTIIWNGVTYNPKNAYNSTTGEFTCPETGYYQIGGTLFTVANTWANGENVQLLIYKNGTLISLIGDVRFQSGGPSRNQQINGTDTIYLVAGDIVTLRCYVARSGGVSLFSDSTLNFFYINKIASNADIIAGLAAAARYEQNTNVAVTGGADFNFANKVFDTNNAFAAGVYTAPITGYYQFNARMYISAAQYLLIYVNGVVAGQGSNGDTAQPSTYSDIHFLNAGDTISVRPGNSGTTSGGNYLTNFSIVRVTDPALAQQPNQKVVAKYSCTTTPSFTTLATIVYDTAVQDTHAAYNSSTGVFTAPVTGTYSFSANAMSSSVFGGGQNWDLIAYKNGSIIEAYDWIKGSPDANTVRSVKVSSTVQLAAGDTFEIQTQTSGSTITLTSSVVPSLFSIFLIN